ncbi:pilin [uncultured Desulfosarcina sp.]|uniref:pilin n=1 Tax=uncultured Desulfosarcina sp. TaxID=218289 RepID=UPI00374810A8
MKMIINPQPMKLLIITILLLVALPVSAQPAFDDTVDGYELDPGVLNPLPTDNPATLIGMIIRAILGVTGSLALLMFIYGGLKWMLSSGNTEELRKGKETLLWAVLGLAVIFSSYAVIRYVFGIFGQ